MQRMGLNPAQFAAYSAGLGITHERRIIVQVLNLEGKLLGTLTNRVLSGQIVTDTSTQPLHVLTMDLYDPNSDISFEPEVNELSVHLSRMVRVIDRRIMPQLVALGVPRGEVNCPVFTGPLSKPPKRDGAVVSIDAHDKSILAMGDAWAERVFPKGTPVERVLKEMMRDTGETDAYISITSGLGRLGNKLVVARFDKRWTKARKLARSRKRNLFYNGAGVAIARRAPKNAQWSLPPSMLLSPVRLDRDAGNVKNFFRVVGGVPQGKNKKRVISDAYALPKSHPDNPVRLGRNGKPRRLVETEENDQIKKKSVANAIAMRMRDDAMSRSASISCDVAPFPHGEPYDLIRVTTPTGTSLLRMLQYTLTLADGSMSLGYKRSVTGRARGARGGGGKGKGGSKSGNTKPSRGGGSKGVSAVGTMSGGSQ